MVTLRIYNYNNYFNRIVKIMDKSNPEFGNYIHQILTANFNTNDGITTEHICGSNDNRYDGTGNYLVCLNEYNDITSRWFIIESKRERGGQYRLTLKRDLMADYYDEIINSPCFVERGILPDSNNLIFNSENMSFNQIKKREYLLEDETKSLWLVGYVARKSSAEGGGPTPLSASIKYNLDYVADYTVEDESELSTLEFYQYLNTPKEYSGGAIIDLYFKPNGETISFNSIDQYGAAVCPLKAKVNTVERGYGWTTKNANPNSFEFGAENAEYVLSYLNKTPLTVGYENSMGYGNRYFAQYLYNATTPETWRNINNEINRAVGTIESDTLGKYANKVVKVGEEYYKIQVETLTTSSTTKIIKEDIPLIEELFRGIYNEAAHNYLQDYPGLITDSVLTNLSDNKRMVGIRTYNSGTAQLILVPFSNTKVNATITTDNNALMCVDSPYDIITMPYSDNVTIIVDDNQSYKSNKTLALATMSALLTQEGSGVGAVKDVQLLPYCPLRQFIDENGNIDLRTTNEDTNFSTRLYYVMAGETQIKITPLIYCQHSRDSFDIPLKIDVSNYKMNNECDMWRLNSPNFSSIFEFNAAKNRGVNKFNVDFHYKPFNPYIHINPDFNGLYGQDWNDPRGLICSGDFSITTMTDTFEQYELQNKNYEKTFQRQVENMEVTHEVARTQDIVKAITGSVTGASAGAMAGGMIGGGWGAAAGAIVGGAASIAGGIADYNLNEKLRDEQMSYFNNIYNYNLGNIKAIPNTIAKVSAFNNNNKGFPVLEYYTCTNEEKDALGHKIAYESMTVMTLSTINNFIGNKWFFVDSEGEIIESKGYIKGKIVRFNGINEDYHLTKAIADEVNKGVYI